MNPTTSMLVEPPSTNTQVARIYLPWWGVIKNVCKDMCLFSKWLGFSYVIGDHSWPKFEIMVWIRVSGK
jgi:hypothetical protein